MCTDKACRISNPIKRVESIDMLKATLDPLSPLRNLGIDSIDVDKTTGTIVNSEVCLRKAPHLLITPNDILVALRGPINRIKETVKEFEGRRKEAEVAYYAVLSDSRPCPTVSSTTGSSRRLRMASAAWRACAGSVLTRGRRGGYDENDSVGQPLIPTQLLPWVYH